MSTFSDYASSIHMTRNIRAYQSQIPVQEYYQEEITSGVITSFTNKFGGLIWVNVPAFTTSFRLYVGAASLTAESPALGIAATTQAGGYRVSFVRGYVRGQNNSVTVEYPDLRTLAFDTWHKIAWYFSNAADRSETAFWVDNVMAPIAGVALVNQPSTIPHHAIFNRETPAGLMLNGLTVTYDSAMTQAKIAELNTAAGIKSPRFMGGGINAKVGINRCVYLDANDYPQAGGIVNLVTHGFLSSVDSTSVTVVPTNIIIA